MIWVHDVSLAALAAAVLTLGLVILLELRAIASLRRVVDGGLARVFEQLDLLRFENQQLIEAQSRPVGQAAQPARAAVAARPAAGSAALEPADIGAHAVAVSLVAGGSAPADSAARPALAAGEARLLASLAAARARRAGAQGPAASGGTATQQAASAAAPGRGRSGGVSLTV